MNQSTVAHTEIGLRLTICSEFLLDEEKPVEELYRKWMRRVGGPIIEFAEFEYWYKRFKNNQFDLGYDTSMDSEEISEIHNTMNSEAGGVRNSPTMIMETEAPVEVVQRQTENLNLNHQFEEENVPEIFQTLFNRRSRDMRKIRVHFNEQMCTITVDTFDIHWRKRHNDWMIRYLNSETVNTTYDPEKSIIDHLWFVLKNPNIKLSDFEIFDNKNPKLKLNEQNCNTQKMDSEKMNSLLQAMFNTFDHQIQISAAECCGFNEDTCLSMLKHVKPGTLEQISLDILWKEEGNYQKMKEIVETDQWKQATRIYSHGVSTLKIDDLFQCERIFLTELKSITSKDVLSVVEHFFNSAGRKYCYLDSLSKSLDFEEIRDVFRSRNDGTQIIDSFQNELFFSFKIVKSAKSIFLEGDKNYIKIQNYPKY